VGTALPAAEEPLEGAEMDEMKARLEMLKSWLFYREIVWFHRGISIEILLLRWLSAKLSLKYLCFSLIKI
jgi:hypothetical protein